MATSDSIKKQEERIKKLQADLEKKKKVAALRSELNKLTPKKKPVKK